MKFVKFLIASSLCVAALAPSVFAVGTNEANTVYITGSSAFRKAAVGAILAAYDASPTPVQINDSANTASVSANTTNTTFLFTGKISGTTVNVACTLTGSVSGTWAVSGSKQIPFLFVNAATTFAATPTKAPSAYTNSDSDSGAVNTDSNINPTCVPDICFSDVFQGTTIYSNSAVVNTDDGASTTYKNMTDTIVGIPSFKWIASNGFPLNGGTAPKSNYNVTPRFANYLLQNGIAQLSFMTGNTSDQGVEIYATGRNPDSGTRLTAFIDTGFGALSTAQQYNAASLSGFTVTALQLWPSPTGFIAGNSVAAGNNGAGSGADLRPYLGYVIPTSSSVSGNPVTACYFLTYLGLSDATTVLAQAPTTSAAGAGVELNYNGVAYSDNAIYQGQYSFWSYEHCEHRTASFAAPASTVYSKITSFLTNASNSSTVFGFGAGYSIADPKMLVKRSGDGQVILPTTSFPF